MAISMGRGNANKALVGFTPFIEKADAMISSFEGGSLRNAIPESLCNYSGSRIEGCYSKEIAATFPREKSELSATSQPSCGD